MKQQVEIVNDQDDPPSLLCRWRQRRSFFPSREDQQARSALAMITRWRSLRGEDGGAIAGREDGGVDAGREDGGADAGREDAESRHSDSLLLQFDTTSDTFDLSASEDEPMLKMDQLTEVSVDLALMTYTGEIESIKIFTQNNLHLPFAFPCG